MSFTNRKRKPSNGTTRRRLSPSGNGSLARRKSDLRPQEELALRERHGEAHRFSPLPKRTRRPASRAAARPEERGPEPRVRHELDRRGSGGGPLPLLLEEEGDAVEPEHESHRGERTAEAAEERVVAPAPAHLEPEAGRVGAEDEPRVVVEAADLAQVHDEPRAQARHRHRLREPEELRNRGAGGRAEAEEAAPASSSTSIGPARSVRRATADAVSSATRSRPRRASTPSRSFASTRSRSDSRDVGESPASASRPPKTPTWPSASTQPSAPSAIQALRGDGHGLGVRRRGVALRGAPGPSGRARSAVPPWAARSAAPRPSSRGGAGPAGRAAGPPRPWRGGS